MASFSPVMESADADHEDNSDLDIPSAKRKFSGSATYSSKYDALWKKQYPCIEAVKNDVHSFYCTCCMKKSSCKHMGGIADVKRHVQGSSHQKASKGLEKQSKLSFTSLETSVKRKLSVLRLK